MFGAQHDDKVLSNCPRIADVVRALTEVLLLKDMGVLSRTTIVTIERLLKHVKK